MVLRLLPVEVSSLPTAGDPQGPVPPRVPRVNWTLASARRFRCSVRGFRCFRRGRRVLFGAGLDDVHGGWAWHLRISEIKNWWSMVIFISPISSHGIRSVLSTVSLDIFGISLDAYFRSVDDLSTWFYDIYLYDFQMFGWFSIADFKQWNVWFVARDSKSMEKVEISDDPDLLPMI